MTPTGLTTGRRMSLFEQLGDDHGTVPEQHPRMADTPTHASWLNQIEIVFSILARRLLKHGIFTSEDDLAQQMLAFIETYNQTAKPFAGTYTGKTLSA
jgi:hypothetical protein